MEQCCVKCDFSHSRPVGRCCQRMGRATNISTAQACVAVSAIRTMHSTNTQLSRVSFLHNDNSTAVEEPSTSSAAVSRAPSVLPFRTEELILIELQKLAGCMTHIEQEMQGESLTSTPRTREKAGPSTLRGESIIGTSNVTGNQTTLMKMSPLINIIHILQSQFTLCLLQTPPQ